MAEEGLADEVKVFRRNDADDVEGATAHTSLQLTEDKKDAALETELETRNAVPANVPGEIRLEFADRQQLAAGSKSSPAAATFAKPNVAAFQAAAAAAAAAAMSPTYGSFMPFFPFLMGSPYGMTATSFSRLAPPAHDPSRTTTTPNSSPFVLSLDQRLSPHYAAPYYFGAGAVSPNFDFYRNFHQSLGNPASPLHATPAATNAKHSSSTAVPLAASVMRNMAAAAAAAAVPLNSMNQMRLPPPSSTTSMPSTSDSPQQPLPVSTNGHHAMKKTKVDKLSKEDRHIKKPLNAFMWFMKENRPKLMEEQNYKERQSAELNKELGRRWHTLAHDEQQKYYQMAKDDREKHMMNYPGWSARENYALNKKKKRKRDKSLENVEQKKCRARFGVNNQTQWCKHCRRKKRCLLARGRDERAGIAGVAAAGLSPPGMVSSTTPGTPLINSPGPNRGVEEDDDEDDEEEEEESLTSSNLSDCDGEDPIAAAQALADSAALL